MTLIHHELDNLTDYMPPAADFKNLCFKHNFTLKVFCELNDLLVSLSFVEKSGYFAYKYYSALLKC